MIVKDLVLQDLRFNLCCALCSDVPVLPGVSL